MIPAPYLALTAFVLAFAGGLLLTGAVRRRAIASALLDHPNSRSSHVEPTPRGGGIAICAVVLVYLVYAGFVNLLPLRTVLGIAGGGAVVALVGFIDDVRSLSPGLRLATHFAAAAWTLTFLNGFPSISVGDLTLPLGPAGVILAGFGLVWATNLFNFMDGIDGIAGVETLSVAGVGGLLLLRTGNLGLGLLALVLAGSALGFLRWNWPPAQIFLGDVGSGFIGFMLAALAIASENSNAVPVLVWAILFAAFIVDATITLVRRFRGRLWREAHKTHAYQRAVQAGGKHASVTSAIVAVNLLLALLAFGAVSGAIGVQVALVLAFAVCVTIYWGVERVRPLRLKDLDDSTAGVDDRSLTASLDDTPLAVRNSQDKSR